MEKMGSVRTIIKVYAFILILGLLFGFFASYVPGMAGQDVLALKAEDFTPSLVSKKITQEKDQLVTHRISFQKEDLANSLEKPLFVTIPRLASNGYEVVLNGQLLGVAGNIENGQSNLWNGVNHFTIDPRSLESNNLLEIKNFAYYQAGLSTYPVYITNLDKTLFFSRWFRFFNHQLVYMGVGMMLLSLLMLLILHHLTDHKEGYYLAFGAAMFFIGLYGLDYTSVDFLGISYFAYKKMTMLSFWAASMLMGLGLFKVLKEKIVLYAGVVGFLGMLLITVGSPNLIFFKKAYSIWYFSQLFNIFLWTIVTLRHYRFRAEARILFYGFALLTIYSITNAVLDLQGLFFGLNSPLIYIAVFSMMPLMLVFFDVITRKERLATEQAMRKLADEKAHRDALTGTFNKHYFYHVMETIEPVYTVIMFDFDDFKGVNDLYGHDAGDEVLRRITRELLDQLRPEDILCRIGGDEFILIIPGHIAGAHRLVEDFRKHIEQLLIPYHQFQLRVTLSFGMYHVKDDMDPKDIFRKVDEALYQSKHSGKNTIRIQQ